VEEENKQLNLAIVSSNNHYAGFGPGTANMFRKMVGLSELSWLYKTPEQQTDANNSIELQRVMIGSKASSPISWNNKLCCQK
jgi:hypothetical protein